MANIIDSLLQQNKQKIINSVMRSAEGRTQLAIIKAGTEDKSSRAYKSARRSIERRVTTGKEKRGQTEKSKPYNPNLNAEQLRELAKESKASAFPNKLNVRVHGEIVVSGDRRTRAVNLQLHGSDEVEGFIRRAIEDEKDGLMYLFETEGVMTQHTNKIDVNDYSVTYK